MDSLYLLVPLSVLIVFIFGLLFWWALNNRQFDSLDEVGARILEDSDNPESTHEDAAKELK